jgi:nucleoside-diphosphate-sugar epimerase
MLNVSVEPIHEPARVGDVRHSMADISQARERLGYEPAVDFAEVLSRSVEYYRAIGGS